MDHAKDLGGPVLHSYRGLPLPVPAVPAGYAWLIHRYALNVPLPARMVAINPAHTARETEQWLLLTPPRAPQPTDAGHLRFALKWEGVDLGVLKAYFTAAGPSAVREMVEAGPTGAYARRLWFLYEWLTGETLDAPSPGKVRAAPALDPTQQIARSSGEICPRTRVLNNLPGTPAFCPLVWRTARIDTLLAERLDQRARRVLSRTHPDVVARTAAFLLLSDSRSSFAIEGEHPGAQRTSRWGAAIAEAGQRPLDIPELERLQHLVIGDNRFLTLGLRTEGGFVGAHDRRTGEPIPDHISARPEDLVGLLNGVFDYTQRALSDGIDPVVAAAATAFGFIYIHPLEDGNGRVHRYLIHHVLAEAGYSPPGVVFPVSAAMLSEIERYREVLEHYSARMLPCVDYRATADGNVEVLNATADLYRYFDATAQTDFLLECVRRTVEHDLPEETAYLESYDAFRRELAEHLEMPERLADRLYRFLHNGDGRLAARRRRREFALLTDSEVGFVESLYKRTRRTPQEFRQEEPPAGGARGDSPAASIP